VIKHIFKCAFVGYKYKTSFMHGHWTHKVLFCFVC